MPGLVDAQPRRDAAADSVLTTSLAARRLVASVDRVIPMSRPNAAPRAGINGDAMDITLSRSPSGTTRRANTRPVAANSSATSSHPATRTAAGSEVSQLTASASSRRLVGVDDTSLVEHVEEPEAGQHEHGGDAEHHGNRDERR